jgi:CubicO group peptidase (beta-lactamase class C family)
MLLDDWKLQPETDMSIPGGAGSIVSTPADLVKFIQGLFGLKIISASSVLQMKTITDGYGMGMFQIPFYEKKAYGHGGRIDGFESMLSYFPEDSLAVSYMTNGKVYPVNDILIGVLSIYYNRNYAIPTFDVVKVADLDKYVGIYSSKQMPLKISVTETNESLFAQATGQAAFPLEPSGNDVFKFTQAGIVMKFNPVKHEFILQQGGAEYLFAKE